MQRAELARHHAILPCRQPADGSRGLQDGAGSRPPSRDALDRTQLHPRGGPGGVPSEATSLTHPKSPGQVPPGSQSERSPTTGRERSLQNLKRRGQPERTRGVPNKATVEGREVTRQLVQGADYRAALARRLLSGRLAPAVETTPWACAFGEPREIHESAGA